MEIKIVINKNNKDQILKLIGQLVEYEAEAMTAESSEHVSIRTALETPDPHKELPAMGNFKVAIPEIRKSKFGSWGMFNSYLPGKTALRVLITLISKNGGNPIRFGELIDESIKYFSRSRLSRFRGFPKRTSDSARTRLRTHLIVPYHEMGLIKLLNNEKNPLIMVTKDGIDFARLQNPLLDEGSRKGDILSEEEREWLINHLRKIDKQGYEEFSLLENLTNFLSGEERRFNDLAQWFRNNESFVEWLKSGSRCREDQNAFSRQLLNVSRTFASGKVALLRELGIISTSRAKYHVLRNLEGKN